MIIGFGRPSSMSADSEVGENPPCSLWTPDAAISLVVPDEVTQENAFEKFGQANEGTRDEALALREWVGCHGASSITEHPDA
jgi:hypothetical protein